MQLPLNPLRRGADAVSPTAHYTGHVWVRNGLSHPALATREGRIFYDAVEPVMRLRRATGGGTLEEMLLGRHRVIDELLARAIESGSVTQVIEVAAGMSPRGWRFCRRFGDRLTYVEADLPAMAERKRQALRCMGDLGAKHRVAELDAERDDGPASIDGIAATLQPDAGVAVITEGLLTYLEHDAVLSLWERIAQVLARFPSGLYLSDLRLAENAGASERVFYVFLSAFVRGRVHVHFENEPEAVAALVESGFTAAQLHATPSGLVHVLEARTGR